RAVLTRFWTRASEVSRSVPTSKVMVRAYEQSLALVEDMSIEFSTPLIACPSGTPIVEATTSALAPGYRVLTWMVGGTISGYWATGRPERNTPPTTRVTRAMALGKSGR